nr:exonuclease domain-containing protein [uncultured Agathobaculum sp.]
MSTDINTMPTVSRKNKGHNLLTLSDTYVAIDAETTGLDPQFDGIIELAAIRYVNGAATDQFQTLVNPEREISSFITELTGITNEMLASAPTINDVLPSFIDFVGDSVVLGHNVNFDVNFIYDAYIETCGTPFTNNFIDTMRFSRRLFPNMQHRLIDLIQKFDIGKNVEHRALGDAKQTATCYEYMKSYMNEKGISIDDIQPKGSHAYNSMAKDIHTSNTSFDETSPIFDRVFVFTGKLDRMPRRDAMQIVVDLGGKCGDKVTKATNYLVLGCNDYCKTIKDGKSDKQKKAEKLKLQGQDIEIITENVFYDMITP